MIMNSKAFLVIGTIMVAMLVSFSIGSTGVIAESYIEMTVFPNDVSVCPCSAITPQHVTVNVKNLHYNTDTYAFTLIPPSGWNSQIQDSITLASGEEGMLDLFLVNIDCNVPKGVYSVLVSAESLTRGETTTQTMEIEVLTCRGAEMSVTDNSKDVCFENPLPITYEMSVKNLGKFEETFQLSSPVNWVGFSETEVTLNGGESRSFSVVLNPQDLAAGTHIVPVHARSTNPASTVYYAPIVKNLELEVKDCYDFTANMQPQENTVCLGKTADYSLIIENTGIESDSYSIFVPDWIIAEESTVSLSSGESIAIGIIVMPSTTGSHEVGITVTSVKETGLSMKVVSTAILEECRSVAVIASPSEYTVCGGMPPVSFDISVKNTGTVEATYQLSSILGIFESATMTLAPGETKSTIMEVDMAGLVGDVTITVRASDGDIYDETDINLVLENCYSADLTIIPDSQSVCPYDSVNYTVMLKNTGKLTDSYNVRYGDVTESFDLGPDESQSFMLTFLVPFEEAGIYVVSASTESDHVSLIQTAALSVRTVSECYNGEIDIVETKKIKPCTLDECEAIIVPVDIKNTGGKSVYYALLVEGPDWVHMEPTVLDLGPGETGTAYVYLSPGFGVGESTYTIMVKAESEHFGIVEALDVIVTENLTAEQPDVTLNASVGNITGALIDADRPAWKTIVVAVIALIIIIILAVRFILLVKK
jgi:archaellum component FlaG (FlaF/FlaG flagellin family)